MRKLLIVLLVVLFNVTANIFAQSAHECRQMLAEYFDIRSRELPYSIDDTVVVEKLNYENCTLRLGLQVNDRGMSVQSVADRLFGDSWADFAPREATAEIKNFLKTMIKAGTRIEFVFKGLTTNQKVIHLVSLKRLEEVYGMMH